MSEEEATEPEPDAEAADGTDEAEEGETDESVLGPTSTDLVARATVADEQLGLELEDHLLELEGEREEQAERADDLESRLKRKQADFENYKKRAKKRQEQIEERATEDLVERLLDVRDDLKRAVEDDHDDLDALREGVEMTLRELDRVLDDEGVSEIAPEPGAEVDPERHEVMMRVESDRPADTVADLYKPGYEMAGKVVRAAQVTVSDGDESADGGDEGDAETSDDA